MAQKISRRLRVETLEDRRVLSVTLGDLQAAGISQRVVDYIDTNTYENEILNDETLANTLVALNSSQTVPAGATLITSGSQFSNITAGTASNPNNYHILGNITRTSTFDVPSHVNIYVEGSIFYAGTHNPGGGVHDTENTGSGASAIFRMWNKDNINLIGIDNAVLHSTNNLSTSSNHATGVFMGGGTDDVTIEGFEIHHVWEGVAAHGGGLNNIVVKNNYIHDTLDRAIWSLATTNFRAVHNFIENAGVDSLDWDYNTQHAIAYENVSVGAGRWAGFVEEGTNDSYFIRGLAIMADFENPNSGWQMGWADNGTKSGPNNLTEHNYFIDNITIQQPGSFITSNGSPAGGGGYFSKEGYDGKGPTYFWANRGEGLNPIHSSGDSWVNAEWLDYVPTAGGRNNSVNGVQLLANLDAEFNAIQSGNVLFIRGSAGSGGFLENESDEQLADITNFQTFQGNHGWGTLASTLESAGYSLTQVIEGTTPDESGAPVSLSSMNLDNYDVIVFGSNNAVYTQADVDAFEQYILDGGGALFISDANFGSDWADASNSDQPFLDLIGVEVHQDHGTYVVGDSPGEVFAPSHPIFTGINGGNPVSKFSGEGVTPFHVKENISGVEVTLLAGAEGQTRLNQPPFGGDNQGPLRPTNSSDASVFSATYGEGRIVGHYDRNTFFNLNGAGANITQHDNQQYAVNIFDWLAAPAGAPGDFDGDGNVDTPDLDQWRGDYGINGDSDADFDNDSDGFDFLAWQRNFSPKPPVTEEVTVILDTDFTQAQGYSTGDLEAHPGWYGQSIAQLNASGTGTVTSNGGPYDRNMWGIGATGGANALPSSAGFNADDVLRITFDYQFSLSGNTNTDMANVGFRNEGPLISNGWESKPLQGFQLEFDTAQAANGGTVKLFPDMNDSNDSDALLLDGLDVGINPGSGDLVSDRLRVSYEASTNGSGSWTVESLSIENLDSSNVYDYTGPTQTFSYADTDAFYAHQLAPNNQNAFAGTVDAVRYEYVTQVAASLSATVAASTSVVEEPTNARALAGAAQTFAAEAYFQTEEHEPLLESSQLLEEVLSPTASLTQETLEPSILQQGMELEVEGAEEAVDSAFAELEFTSRLSLA